MHHIYHGPPHHVSWYIWWLASYIPWHPACAAKWHHYFYQVWIIFSRQIAACLTVQTIWICFKPLSDNLLTPVLFKLITFNLTTQNWDGLLVWKQLKDYKNLLYLILKKFTWVFLFNLGIVWGVNRGHSHNCTIESSKSNCAIQKSELTPLPTCFKIINFSN